MSRADIDVTLILVCRQRSSPRDTFNVLFFSLQDWRVHVEQMHQHKDGIENSLKDTKSYLDKLYDEITRTLEKIASREKYINSQLEHHLAV